MNISFEKELNSLFHDLSLNYSLIASCLIHGIVIAALMWITNRFYPNSPLKFPQTIILVSFPTIEKRNIKTPLTPQRVRTVPVAKTNFSSAVSTSIEPKTTATSSSSSEMNPVASIKSIQKEFELDSSQSKNTSGSSSTTKEEGSTAFRIGSLRALDNVDFSPLYNPKPAYPPFALKAGIEGSVDVDLLINEFGRVEEFAIIKIFGHPSFGDEAAKVIGKWRFPPPRIKGKKIKIKYLYTIYFKID
jgi:TonB family protein